jgi:hypothetical protein
MKCSPKRSSVLALAISGLVLTSAVGCGDGDQRAADKDIRKNVAAALDARRVPTTQGVNDALTKLGSAEKSAPAASLVGKIDAKSNLAQVELEAGRREARALSQIEPQISQTLWEIALIGGQIDRLNSATAAGAKGTPDATLKAIADRRALMVQMGEAASKKAAELQGEIDKIKAQVATLTQQKDAAATEADTLSDKASKATGKEGSDLADQATEARRKAGNAGHEVDKVAAALLPLERDLAVQQQQKKTADEAVATLDQNKAGIDAAWQSLQARGSDQKELAAKLGQDLATKGQRLAALDKQAAETRAKALEYFNKSADHSAAAAKDATALATELGKWGNNFPTSPEKKAWDQLKSTYGTNTFRLAEAEAENAAANLHNEHALLLQYRQQVASGLTKVLQEAGIAMPPMLAGGAADAEQKKAAEAATAAYTSAAQKFMDVYQAGTTPKELQNTARVSRMFSLYGQYVAGDRSKLADAKQEYAEAFAEHKDDSLIRALPPELRPGAAAPAPGAPAPTPGTTPPAPAPRGAAPTPAAPAPTTPAAPAPGAAAPAPGAQDLNK